MSNDVNFLINGRETLSNAADKSVSGLHRLAEGLEGLKGKLRQFNTVLELAFGFQVGRKLFDQLHEGAARLGEGFAEARKEGMSFWDSVDDGIKKAMGITTVTQKVKELKAALKSGQGELDTADKSAQSVFDVLGVRGNGYGDHSAQWKDGQFSRLGPAGEKAVQDYLAGIEAAKRRILEGQKDEKGNPVGDSYGAATARLGARKQQYENLKVDQLSFFERIGLRMNGIDPKFSGLKAEIEKDQEAVNGFQAQIRALDSRASEMRKQAQGKVGSLEGADYFRSMLFGGFTPGGGVTLGFAGNAAARFHAITGALSETFVDPFTRTGGIVDQFRHPRIFPDNPNFPSEINQQIDELRHSNLSPQQKSLAATRIIQGFESYFGTNKGNINAGSIGAENQRFLTRAPGPVKTPELTELEKITRAMEQLGEARLPDLIAVLKNFGPIGVADK